MMHGSGRVHGKKNGKNQLCHPRPPHFHHYCCDECSKAYCIICSSVYIDNNTLEQMGNEKWLSGEWYQADARLVRVYLCICTMALALIGEVSSSRTRKREMSPELDLMWVSECQGTWHTFNAVTNEAWEVIPCNSNFGAQFSTIWFSVGCHALLQLGYLITTLHSFGITNH